MYLYLKQYEVYLTKQHKKVIPPIPMYQPAWLPDVAHHGVRRESELRCGTRGRLQPPGSSSWNFKPLISLDGATGLAAAVLRPNFIPVVALIEGSLFVCLMNGRVMGFVCFPAFFTPIF